MTEEQVDRAAEYRDLRRRLEEAVLPLATSVDGRTFELQAPLHELQLEIGGYVVLDSGGTTHLGQVLSLELGHLESAEFSLTVEGTEGTMRAPVSVRAARGTGVVLDGPAPPFLDARVAPADDAAIEQWIEKADPVNAVLTIGSLALAPNHPAHLDAGGFDRHTFLCGQSGSGKTYSLGLVLEQLLAETSLRVIVLDPNSDYVRMAHLREDADPGSASTARYRAAAGGIRVLRSNFPDDRPLHLRFAELEAACQAALLQLDPVEDADEYEALLDVLKGDEGGTPLVSGLEDLVGLEGTSRLGRRATNLGMDRLDIWEAGRGGSLVEMMAEDEWRCLVVDLGSLGDRKAQGVVTNAVLATLWKLRNRRQPVLVVIDEAHNICPALPGDGLAALATEQTVQIAAEGRKFGIHLLVSTQRPQKVHENVLSQCDNLVLMRMNSASDLAYLGEMFSFVPGGLLAKSRRFGLGEALVAGKIAPEPALVRFGKRISEEGGADVGQGWANRI